MSCCALSDAWQYLLFLVFRPFFVGRVVDFLDCCQDKQRGGFAGGPGKSTKVKLPTTRTFCIHIYIQPIPQHDTYKD